MRSVRHRGFTVIEMMVVLIIIGMALVLGFQSLGQWQIAEATLDRMSAATRARALASIWWADSVRGLTPVDARVFRGDGQSMEGLTLAPVFGQPGAVTPIRWMIMDDPEAGLALQLSEDGRDRLFALTDVVQARFRYVSREGEASDNWPSESLGLEGTNLPAYVELVMRDSAGSEAVWASFVVGPLEQPYKPMYFDDE